MMFQPYILLAGLLAILGAFAGGELHGRAARDEHWGRVFAEQSAEAANMLAGATARAAQKDTEYAELANRIDQERNAMATASAASRDDFAKRLRDAKAERRRSCGGAAASETANPGQPANAAPSGESGHREGGSGLAIRDAVKELQEFVVGCHGWAISVGR